MEHDRNIPPLFIFPVRSVQHRQMYFRLGFEFRITNVCAGILQKVLMTIVIRGILFVSSQIVPSHLSKILKISSRTYKYLALQ